MAKNNFKNIEVKPEDINFDTMIFCKNWLEILNKLPDEKFREGVNSLCNYAFNGTVPESFSDFSLEIVFNMAQPLMDANIKARIASQRGVKARQDNKAKIEKKPKEKVDKGAKSEQTKEETKEDTEKADKEEQEKAEPKEETAAEDQKDAPKEETKETVTPKETKQEETTSPDEEEPWQVPLDEDGYVLWNQVPDEHMQEAKEYCERHKNEGLENEQKHL